MIVFDMAKPYVYISIEIFRSVSSDVIHVVRLTIILRRQEIGTVRMYDMPYHISGPSMFPAYVITEPTVSTF
jgi:hypothetical protein